MPILIFNPFVANSNEHSLDGRSYYNIHLKFYSMNQYFIIVCRQIWEVTSREEDKESSLGEEATEPTLMYARWMTSSDASTDAIVFVEDYNIFYIPDVGAEEKKIFPLSQAEVVIPEVIFHGIPDWIYEGKYRTRTIINRSLVFPALV